jgi:hypothetical protein
MRGKKSVASHFADSADLIGNCAEFVVALRVDVNVRDFARAINVVARISYTSHERSRREVDAKRDCVRQYSRSTYDFMSAVKTTMLER